MSKGLVYHLVLQYMWLHYVYTKTCQEYIIISEDFYLFLNKIMKARVQLRWQIYRTFLVSYWVRNAKYQTFL